MLMGTMASADFSRFAVAGFIELVKRDKNIVRPPRVIVLYSAPKRFPRVRITIISLNQLKTKATEILVKDSKNPFQ